MQIIVDDVNLDNGSYRRMLGQIKNTNLGGVTSVVNTFIIMGDTPTQLNLRWQEAQAAFNKKNPRVVIFGDDSASTPTEDISWLDGKHTSLETTISWSPDYVQTGYRLICTFVCAAQTSLPSASGGGQGGNAFQGQDGGIKLVKVYSTGNVKSRIVEATFVATYDDDKFGPFVLTAVADGGGGYSGKAKFTLTGTLPAFKAGQKITVAGTSNYNGVFEVLAITGQDVQTSKPFGAPESPGAATGVIGEAKTGEENFQAALPTLLTDYLLTSSTGGLDVGNGKTHTLTGKTVRAINKEGSGVLVTLSSGEQQLDLGTAVPSARTFEILVGRTRPETYDAQGGAEPVVYTGKGRVICDKDVLGSGNVSGVFDAAEPSILAEVAAQNNLASSALKLASLSLAMSRDGVWVEFEVSYLSRSVSALKYNVTVTENTTQPLLSHRDADGYHILQIPAGPPDGTVTKTVMRVGFGRINLGIALSPPVQSGFTFVELSRTKIKESPKESLGGEQVFEEVWAAVFGRYRVRRGGGAIAGAQGSGGAFDGSGYFVPTGPDV
jgi:hypothetical protein